MKGLEERKEGGKKISKRKRGDTGKVQRQVKEVVSLFFFPLKEIQEKTITTDIVYRFKMLELVIQPHKIRYKFMSKVNGTFFLLQTIFSNVPIESWV